MLAVPSASYQLALLGAEVNKVENPLDPDHARFQSADLDLVTAAMRPSFLAQGP